MSAIPFRLSDKGNMKQALIPDSLFDWLAGAVERETRRMEKHQSTKLQSDLKTYLVGYELAVKDVLAECERLLNR